MNSLSSSNNPVPDWGTAGDILALTTVRRSFAAPTSQPLLTRRMDMKELTEFAKAVTKTFEDVLQRLAYHDQDIQELQEDILSLRHELKKLREAVDV